MVTEHQMSERHACTLVGLSRDTYRHVSQISALNVELRDQIIQTAHTGRRWGYRMIHDVLRPQRRQPFVSVERRISDPREREMNSLGNCVIMGNYFAHFDL